MKQPELNIDYIKSKCSADWSISNISFQKMNKTYRVTFNLEHSVTKTIIETTLWNSSIEKLEDSIIKHIE